MQRIKSFILGRDIFGHKISVNYRGSEEYNTYLGSVCSVTALVLMLLNLLVLLTAFSDHSKQEENTQQTSIETFESEQYKMSDSSTDIAIVMTN